MDLKDRKMYFHIRARIWTYMACTNLTEFDEESADDCKGKDQNGNPISLCHRICAAASRMMYAIAQDGSAAAEVPVLCRVKELPWIQGPRLGQTAGDLAS